MNTFHLTISDVDGSAFDGPAVRLSLRGTEGDLAVMAGHVPFLTAVRPGECRVLLESGGVRRGRTDGGLLTVTHEKTILLTRGFAWQEDE